MNAREQIKEILQDDERFLSYELDSISAINELIQELVSDDDWVEDTISIWKDKAKSLGYSPEDKNG